MAPAQRAELQGHCFNRLYDTAGRAVGLAVKDGREPGTRFGNSGRELPRVEESPQTRYLFFGPRIALCPLL